VDGHKTRDSRPGAVRKLARGEPVGASPERRERRRRSRSRSRRRGDGESGAAEANGAAPEASVEAVRDAAEPA
jgi:hypothetical protein